jgi:two-component system KDP operon response regulator KdpE
MNESNAIILIVEDEPQIRRFVRGALEAHRWQVFEAGTVAEGLSEAGLRQPDLIILDLGLPDGDGVDYLRELRTWSQVSVIVLSARTDETDKVAALDAGADDYLTKPFSVVELAARVRAALRRGQRASEASSSVFEFGDVAVDFSTRTILKSGVAVHLTPIEYRLLGILIANAGRVMTHRILLREVWGASHSDDTHYLRVYMGQLRQKLETDAARPKHIVTESGIGYRLLTEPLGST